MAEYEAASEAQYTEEQYPGEDPYEGIEVEGYVEQETTPATNQDNYSQDTTQNNTYRGRGRGDSRGGSRGNSRGGRGDSRGGRGGPRGGFAGQKRGYQQQPQNDFSGNMAGSMEFVKKRKINDNVHRILVPTKSVKFIIGPKGENIKAVKESAGEGCKMSIYTQGTNKVPLPEGTAERVVSVEGTEDQLKICLNDLIGKVQGAPMDKIKGRLILKVMIPEHCCSAVIGPKGAHSKKIREDTGTIVQVFTDPLPGSGEHVVALKNNEAEQIVEAAAAVFRLIQEHKSKNNVLLYEPHLWNPGEFGNTGSYHDETYGQQVGGFNQGGGFNNQGGGGGYNNQGGGGGYNNQGGGGGYNNQGGGFNGNQGGSGGFNNQSGGGGYNQGGGGGGYNQGGGGGGGGGYNNQGSGYNSQGYEEQGGYDDQSYYGEDQAGYTEGGDQSAYQDTSSYTDNSYQDQSYNTTQQQAPRGRGGRARGPLLGSSPGSRGAPRGGSQQRGGTPQRGGGFGGRGGNGGTQRGGNGSTQRGSRGAPRAANGGGRGFSAGGRGASRGGRGRGGN